MNGNKLAQFLDKNQENSFYIIDMTVWELHPALERNIDPKKIFLLKNPESNKNLKTFENIIQFLLKNRINRDSNIIAIGGGALSDIAGFVASTVLRGVSWKIVPTTLLSMVDASIGGKVGLNTSYGKNLIGNFYQPTEIFLDFDFLKTLADEEVQSGKGEVLKYCFLDENIYHAIQKNGFNDELILLCADYKKRLIAIDFLEKNERKLLNLGHTFGHAIEPLLNLPHGICVAWGIKLILQIFKKNEIDKFNQLVSLLNLEVPLISQIPLNDFRNYLLSDKKSKGKEQIDIIVPNSNNSCDIIQTTHKELNEKLVSNEETKNLFK